MISNAGDTAYHCRVSLNITHMQLVGEEEPHADELYGIPDRMLHNRKLSRVTGSPQRGSSEYDGASLNKDMSNCISLCEVFEDNSFQTAQSPTPSLIATQRLPSQQSKRPMLEMQLCRPWFARLEQRRVSRGLGAREGDKRYPVHCQCNLSKKVGAMVRSLGDDTYHYLPWSYG